MDGTHVVPRRGPATSHRRHHAYPPPPASTGPRTLIEAVEPRRLLSGSGDSQPDQTLTATTDAVIRVDEGEVAVHRSATGAVDHVQVGSTVSLDSGDTLLLSDGDAVTGSGSNELYQTSTSYFIVAQASTVRAVDGVIQLDDPTTAPADDDGGGDDDGAGDDGPPFDPVVFPPDGSPDLPGEGEGMPPGMPAIPLPDDDQNLPAGGYGTDDIDNMPIGKGGWFDVTEDYDIIVGIDQDPGAEPGNVIITTVRIPAGTRILINNIGGRWGIVGATLPNGHSSTFLPITITGGMIV